MSNGPIHYDWLNDLKRGYALAETNFSDKTTLPSAVAIVGQMSAQLFQDSAEAMSTHHPAIANRLLGIGNQLAITVSGATTSAAPVTLAPVTPATVRPGGVKQSKTYDL